MPHLTGTIKDSLDRCTSHWSVVQSKEDYYNLVDRHSYEVIACWGLPGFSKEVIADQMENSRALKWVHSLSVGVDEHCSIKRFRDSEVPLTNARGAFSNVLAEYVILGILYHAKKVDFFENNKKLRKWKINSVDLVSSKTLVIVGYGDIGSAIAKACKGAFGMKVIGVNKHPAKSVWADEVVGLDEIHRVVPQADYLVAALPKTKSTDNLFDKEFFAQMKTSAIFMNIGRGTTVNEDDLATALYTHQIKGAVLDVFQKEPLPPSSRLWSAPNLFLTPHCADQDKEWLERSMLIFSRNLIKWV